MLAPGSHMKLTRKQLTHAKDVQLAAIGITRHKSQGWLKKAVEMEFTEEQVATFKAVRDAPACFVCGQPANDGTERDVRSVCDAHFIVACPTCGHEAFFVTTRKNPLGRWVCFAGNCPFGSAEPWGFQPLTAPRLWCAMCGKYTDHQSGTCPELQRIEVK